jgi:hypothetical protein
MFEWLLMAGFAVLGLAGVIVTILWPFDQPRNPYAAPFGELPRLPGGSLDRGDCA